ncbi:MAG: hypothetical protein NC452_16010 [Eubacterium sp.]|nr:hypothetical protein [Eubacterium sp.]
MTELQKALIKEFSIPVRNSEQKIWMLRTESGKFYRDFTQNNYVALGWDKVSFADINDNEVSEKSKKEKISLLYPDELRPGLILSQLKTFYFKMKSGDLILIPSESSRQLYVGTIGDVINSVEHIELEDGYDKCEYSHKRRVKWIKPISPAIDIYLNKALKSHQAVTDVTEYADLFYRNIFSHYIDEQSIHLTFQKNTNSNFSVCDSIKLQMAVIEIFKSVSEMYGLPDNSDTFKLKTAVGSPGIIEFIVENFNPANIVSVIMVLLVFGGTTSKDENGKTSLSIGVSSIIDRVNNLLNDHKNRELIGAQIRKSDAETQKVLADIENDKAVTKSIVAKTKAEAKEKEATAKRYYLNQKN